MSGAERPPTGRHRRRRSTGLGALAVAFLLVLMVVGAMFSPVLLGWPPPSRGAAAQPSTVGTPGPAPTTSTTALPSAPPATTRRPPRRTTSPPAPVATIAAFETEVLAQTNARRRNEGCPELRLDTRLRAAARRHSIDMARYGYMSHTGHDGSSPGQRIRDAGYPQVSWAENIARGYPNPSAVMAGWMNSPGHRANILNCSLRALGVGVARGNSGQVFWTQDFGAR